MAIRVRSEQSGLFWALLVLVCLAPLPLGSVYEWSWTLMAGLVGGVLAIWAAQVAVGRQDAHFGLQRTWWLVLPLVVVALWVWIQAISATPDEWHHPLWESAAEALGKDLPGAVSLNPYGSFSTLARLLTYAGVFWLAFQFCHRASRARQVLLWTAIAGVLFAAAGWVDWLLADDGLLWMAEPASEGMLSGPFASRHSFATYAGLSLLALTALLYASLAQKSSTILSQMTREAFTAASQGGKVRRGKPSIFTAEGLRRLMASLSRQDVAFLMGWLCIAGAAIATHSRAGIGSIGFALLALGIVLAVGRLTQRGHAAALAAAVVLALGAAFLVGGEGLERQLHGMAADAERTKVYDLTIAAIKDSPMLGTGYGTFEEVFRFYRTPEITNHYSVAHSSYLGAILELGLPAALALLSIFAIFLALTIRGIGHRSRDLIFPAVGFAATILVAIHSAIDYSLQVPAIAAAYALIMGAACAQCWSTRRPEDRW